MTNEPNKSGESTPFPSSEAIDEALGKVANGQVPERRVAHRRQVGDRRQPLEESAVEGEENEAEAKAEDDQP